MIAKYIQESDSLPSIYYLNAQIATVEAQEHYAHDGQYCKSRATIEQRKLVSLRHMESTQEFSVILLSKAELGA